MKKSLLILFAMCSASYGASDSYDQAGQDRSNCCNEKRDSYAGAYVGAGLSYQHNKNDVAVSDNYGDIAGAWAAYNGFGIDEARKDNPSANNWKLNKKNKGKIGGSVNFGYGKFINSYLYCGADFTLDVASRGKSSDEAERRQKSLKNTTVENGGVVPTVALRVGGYIPAVDSLVCARFGGAFVNAKSMNEGYGSDSEIKIRKLTPIIGLSFERNVLKNWSVKLEGDYRFSTKKEKLIVGKTQFGVEQKALVKAKTGSYCVRLVGVYRFN